MTPQTESQSRLDRPLIQLAKQSNVFTSYIGQTGDFNEIDDEVIIKVLDALGVAASTDADIEKSLETLAISRATALLPGTVFAVLGTQASVVLHHRMGEVPTATLILEDGSDFGEALNIGPSGNSEAAFPYDDDFYVTSVLEVPATVPMGYHTLTVNAGGISKSATLIVAPDRVPLHPDLEHGQLWGWMAQLYSLRSHQSWGVGDFADLAQLAVEAKKKTGADYMLINPTHAAEPVTPLTPSPYLPDSRRFVNFTYIRPEVIEEYNHLDSQERSTVDRLHKKVEILNDKVEYLDRDAMWEAKKPALRMIFEVPRSGERQKEFDEYKRSQGTDLDSYAIWCLAYEKWGEPTVSPDSWVKKYSITSSEVVALVNENTDSVEFYRWLEWIADTQLSDAQARAKESGMSIGLMLDMAVGVHPLGSDVWAKPEQFAKGATVGAPPDFYNQQGQDWSQPPLHPHYLEKSGYKPFRDLMHHMFSGAGALRIDHILGLFRLWWVPEGSKANQGTYVGYDSDVMLGILAIEASRAKGVVIGEDLGVVPIYVATALRSHGLLGSVIEWFEKDKEGNFVDPATYREYAIASVTTHDLPPTAGYLNFEQVKIREELNLLADSEKAKEFIDGAHDEHTALLDFLVKGGWLDPAARKDEHANEQQIVEAMHKVLKSSRSKLLCAAVVDGVGERRSQNQPGTNNEYPNWRIPLADANLNPVYVEDLFNLPRVRSLGAVMNA